MNMFDDYVRSLLHYYLNFYSAFSPERGRKQGELESIIYSDLSRCGAAGSIHEVKGCIDRELARIPAFARKTEDRIWLDFRQTTSVAEAADESRSDDWEAQVRSSKFAGRVPGSDVDDLVKRVTRVQTTVQQQIASVDCQRFLDEYGRELFNCLNLILQNNQPECINIERLKKLKMVGTREHVRTFSLINGEASVSAVFVACSKINGLLTKWLP
jgi:hypothetical protein